MLRSAAISQKMPASSRARTAAGVLAPCVPADQASGVLGVDAITWDRTTPGFTAKHPTRLLGRRST